MSERSAVILTAVTFVAGVAVCLAIFAAFDVPWPFLPGPLIALAIAAHGVFRAARDDRRTDRGHTPGR